MKKISSIIVLLLLVGCSAGQDTNREGNALTSYERDDLPFSFSYPEALGTVEANLQKSSEIAALNFQKPGGQWANVQITKAEEPEAKSCSEYLTDGLYQGDVQVKDCIEVRADWRTIPIVELAEQPKARPARIAFIPAKSELWELAAYDQNFYEAVEQIAESIQFND